MGDFNIVVDGPEYAALLAPSGRHGSTVHDVWSLSSEQQGKGFTYPSDKPEKRIDFAFASPELKNSIGRVWTGVNNGASDHLPYYFDVTKPY
jgi:endonuclease/exonuclease/phosphatase family metal-dependent hydrolase